MSSSPRKTGSTENNQSDRSFDSSSSTKTLFLSNSGFSLESDPLDTTVLDVNDEPDDNDNEESSKKSSDNEEELEQSNDNEEPSEQPNDNQVLTDNESNGNKKPREEHDQLNDHQNEGLFEFEYNDEPDDSEGYGEYEGNKEHYATEEPDENEDDENEEHDDIVELSDFEYIMWLQTNLTYNLKTLADYGKFGLEAKPNKFLELQMLFTHYHFYLTVPYAGKMLKWEIIFDPEDLTALPDFDFNDYSFLPEPDINYIAENIPSWDTWDLTKADSVLNIVKEFLALYNRTHLEKLFNENKYSKYKEQYEELLTNMELTDDQVEVQFETRSEPDERGSTTEDFIALNFLVRLPVDFSRLPEFDQDEAVGICNPGDDYAELYIQFRKLENPQTSMDLRLSPRPEQLLERFKVAKFAKDATLYQYAKRFKDSIEEQIQILWERFEARSQFISTIISDFAVCIVEYEWVRNDKVTFIYEEIEDYTVLVTLKLPHDFPRDKPKIVLQSIYCQVGRGCQATIIYHGYDAEETVDENMVTFREALKSEVLKFQNHRH